MFAHNRVKVRWLDPVGHAAAFTSLMIGNVLGLGSAGRFVSSLNVRRPLCDGSAAERTSAIGLSLLAQE
jgi:hypothetical protein